MTTVKQHRANIDAAVKMVSQVVEAETGITWRRIYQAIQRLESEGFYDQGWKDMTLVDEYLHSIFEHKGWYNQVRVRFSPNLYKTDYTKILENPMWDKDVFNRGLESGWALIDRQPAKK